MKNKTKKDIISIDYYSKTPKYRQIVNSVIGAIAEGKISKDDKLPSVNNLLIEFDISRDTIVKAYDFLKETGIIESVPGKGYYIKTNEVSKRPKILLLFNKLSAHKKIIYDSFAENMGENAVIDFYIYNNDFNLFKKILEENQDINYSYYVIISHFVEAGENINEILSKIPAQKLIILDKKIDELNIQGYASVYQDFETDIYNALVEMNVKLSNYQRLKLIFPSYTYQPNSIKNGFLKYCTEFAFEYEYVFDLENDEPKQHDVFINVMEDDLVFLIKKIKEKKLRVGKDIGIISYNETMIKEVLLDGITTISTDFYLLGKTAAELVLSDRKEHIANPFHVVYRNSL
jgi:DNA-binding transcriptional regulator YhcF (GntR family)